MTLQSPIRGGSTVMDEIHCQHLGTAHHIEEFRMIADLGGVIRGWGSRASQFVGGTGKALDDECAGLSLKVLQDGALIEHDTNE